MKEMLNIIVIDVEQGYTWIYKIKQPNIVKPEIHDIMMRNSVNFDLIQ